ncbi:MAG: hypothetical protein JW885_01905 [Deltaproteobacteria bacterium]|nr:hypothetical protein [Candidatus Zymogenaceae bacterium]
MNQPDDYISVEHLLPSRSSTVLITEIVSHDPDHGITCGLELRGDEHYLKGHFPGAPMLPGVLELEAMFQAACLWYALKSEQVEDENDSLRKRASDLVLSKIRSARFQHTIIPPQSVEITSRIENQTGDEILFSGSITSRNDENPQTFASASFLTVLSGYSHDQ